MVSGPGFAFTEKLDKRIQHEHETETHENQKNPHRRLTLSVSNLLSSRLHRSFCQGISEHGKSGMRVLKKSRRVRKDFIRFYTVGEWYCSELNHSEFRSHSEVTRVQGCH